MSAYSTISKYSQTSSILSSTYGVSSSKKLSSQSSISELFNSYGKNTSKASSSLSSYLVGIKESSADIKSAVKTAQSNSTWNSESYKSDSSAVSISYTGTDKPADMTVDVKAVAKSQVNEGKSLSADKSSVKSTSFSIETADGKSKNFFVATSSSMTNAEAQQKVADKINSAKLGITASVEKDSKTGASKLVLTGKSGEGNDFKVSGALAEELGINKTTQKAQDAVYSINSGEDKTSSTNEIKLDDNTTLNIKDVTEKTANISYSKNNLKGINAARELVNSYNALYDSAKKFDDLGSLKLQAKMVSLNSTYSSALGRVGISTNSEGYLQIDEEKMQEAADSGELKNFLAGDKGQSYGFVNRLDQLAGKVESDPSKFLSSSAKAEIASGDIYASDSDYTALFSNASFRRSYFNYMGTSALFDCLF